MSRWYIYQEICHIIGRWVCPLVETGQTINVVRKIIVGSIDEECETSVEVPNILGYVDNFTWQTLVMDQSDAIKLIMLARNVDYSNAKSQLDQIVEEFEAIRLDIPPGTYNAYYIPEMNEGSGYDTKIVFPDVDINGYVHLIPDMIVTAHELKTTRPIDTDNPLQSDR